MKLILALCLYTLLCWECFSQTGRAPAKLMRDLIRENFVLADSQYNYLKQHIPADQMPQSFVTTENKWISREITWWCSGFYSGSLWLIYEQTGDTAILNEAERALKVIEPNQYYTGNHDLGFMVYCSYGNAYRITKNEVYKPIIFNAAQSLSTRYRPIIESIQSWDSGKNFKCPVIIDNMMNLELLCWVTQQGGDAKYREIAVRHSNSTIKNHFRPDNSSYHVLDYSLSTGQLIGKRTWQGYADSSAWSRGQSWGLYGFVTMYRFTRDPVYLEQAKRIAAFILHHRNLPADKIPYWDYDDRSIPAVPRDASAAAILASALLELGQYTDKKETRGYVHVAELIIQNLSSANYRAGIGENGGFLLKHSTGGLPFNSEVDVPLIYADYYFLEALKRYKDWYLR
jgi:unsaturated chondroitin disaccharide hydrolase